MCYLFLLWGGVMRSPQAENGHTDIANEIMDALAKIRISGEARQVLDFIIRKTYGWHHKWDRIALSQFLNGTGLKKNTVCRAINKLKSMNLIVTKKENDNITSYCFNKHYNAWKSLPKKRIVTKKENRVSQKRESALPKKRHTKETITKETITKETITKEITLESLFKEIENKFTDEELRHKTDFLEYWKEKNPGGKKERWEMEKVFDVNLRFRRWLKNKDTWGMRDKESPLDKQLEQIKNLDLGEEGGLDPDMEVEEKK